MNSIIRTFHPGDYVDLWGTGLGAVAGSDAVAPPVGDLTSAVVHIGDRTAPLAYAGRSSSFPGLDQVVFQVPSGVQGCYVPVAVETGGVVSNVATLAVSSAGQTCTDSILGQDLVDKLAAGNKVDFGYIRLESLFARLAFYSGTQQADYAYASFSEFTPQTAGYAVYGVSSGYCVSGTGGMLGFADLSPSQLDAGGSLSVAGAGNMTVPSLYGAYRAYGNGAKVFWSALNYTISGSGGKNVGAFSATDKTSLDSVTFSGITAAQNVPRSSDLTVQWTGGDATLQNGQVTILAYSEDSAFTLFGSLQCTAPLSARSFTIPAWLLSTLPASGSGQSGSLTYPLGWIQIGQYNNPVSFQAQGLDRGLLTDAFFTGFGVYFQ